MHPHGSAGGHAAGEWRVGTAAAPPAVFDPPPTYVNLYGEVPAMNPPPRPLPPPEPAPPLPTSAPAAAAALSECTSGSGSGSYEDSLPCTPNFATADYGLGDDDAVAHASSVAALRRERVDQAAAAVTGRAPVAPSRIGTLRTAAADPHAPVNPYQMVDTLRGGGGEGGAGGQEAPPRPPRRFLQAVAATVTSPRTSAGRAARSVRSRGVSAEGDVDAAVAHVLKLRAPLFEWEGLVGLDPGSPATWDALDRLASGGPILPKLAECKWTLREAGRLRPGRDESMWATLLRWGFTGNEVARHGVEGPWTNALALATVARVGLRLLHEDAHLTAQDLVAGRVPAGAVGQLASVDGWPSPVPYLVRRMNMDARAFAELGYAPSEWVAILGLTGDMVRTYPLVTPRGGPRLRAAGWTRAFLVEELELAWAEASEMLPKPLREQDWSRGAAARAPAVLVPGGMGGVVGVGGGGGGGWNSAGWRGRAQGELAQATFEG